MSRPQLTPGVVLLGRYTVIEYLAEGGMQQVFRALDASFKRDVALKTPKNTSAVKRFERSARVSARVTHANIAKTLDYFEEDGVPFLVEELVDGMDLGRILEERAALFDPHLAAHILHRLARGLSAAHRAGIFHRDMKPSNIIVSKDDNLDTVKITDFGIAKMAAEELTSAADGGDSSITSSQTAMGALPYMAPEMIQNPRNADRPADVWAVGAIAYRLLSGAFPFGSGLKAVPAIIRAQLPPKPAVYGSLRQFGPLADAIWLIVAKCLVPDPAARLTAAGLLQACSELCYSDATRSRGTVSSAPAGPRHWGLIKCDDGEIVFYHEDSYYGGQPSCGTRVSFAPYPGSPRRRAHPVLPLRTL